MGEGNRKGGISGRVVLCRGSSGPMNEDRADQDGYDEKAYAGFEHHRRVLVTYLIYEFRIFVIYG
jgi:hypothetical protein